MLFINNLVLIKISGLLDPDPKLEKKKKKKENYFKFKNINRTKN